MERTILTIKSLTRANLEESLTFEESVQLAIKTPHNTLNVTSFQMHLQRKPRTANTNMICQPSCFLSTWKKTLTKYVLAQPTGLDVFTINDPGGKLADYLVLNDTRKRARLVSQDFKQYNCYEKETKSNAMKSRFETDKSRLR